VATPKHETTDKIPRGVREAIRFRLRALIQKMRQSLAVAQRRFTRNYDARIRPVNTGINVGDWVFV